MSFDGLLGLYLPVGLILLPVYIAGFLLPKGLRWTHKWVFGTIFIVAGALVDPLSVATGSFFVIWDFVGHISQGRGLFQHSKNCSMEKIRGVASRAYSFAEEAPVA